MKPESESLQLPRKGVPQALAKRVGSRLDRWVRTSGLSWDQIYNSDGLSRSTVKRIKHPTEETVFDTWIERLGDLFTQFIIVANRHKKTPPSPWEKFFGEGVPQPPGGLGLPPAVFSDAEVRKDELTRLAEPLIDYLQSNALNAGGLKNVWKESGLLNKLCLLLEMTSDWERAAECLHQLGLLNRHTGDFHFYADALLREGQAQLHAGDPQAAESTFQIGLRVIEDNEERFPPCRIQLRLLNYLAIAQLSLGDTPAAWKTLSTKSLPLAKKAGSPASVASVHNRLAIVALKLVKLDDAFMHILTALSGRLSRDMRSEVARSLTTLGWVHVERKEPTQAILIGEISLRLQQMLGDHEGIAHTYLLLGTAFLDLAGFRSGKKEERITLKLSPALFLDKVEYRILVSVAKEVKFGEIKISSLKIFPRAEICFQQCIRAEREWSLAQFTREAEMKLKQLREPSR